LIKFIPLAFAAIAPVGMGLVILLLTSRNGLSKALAYLTSQALAFAVWGILFLNLSVNFEGTRAAEATRASLAIRTFLGILLLIIAVRILLTDQDPDALPLKWKAQLEKISVAVLFFINLLLSLLQIRFVMLIMIGADMINSARLTWTGTVVGLLSLLLILLWPQMLPLAIFLTLSDRRDKALQTLDDWLARNSRFINAGLLGLIGIVLVWDSLIDLTGR
jgi:hypothetical protein